MPSEIGTKYLTDQVDAIMQKFAEEAPPGSNHYRRAQAALEALNDFKRIKPLLAVARRRGYIETKDLNYAGEKLWTAIDTVFDAIGVIRDEGVARDEPNDTALPSE